MRALLISLLLARVAAAEDRFRIGAEASVALGRIDGELFGIVGDVTTGPVSLRMRVDRGTTNDTGAAHSYPLDSGGPVTQTRITIGVEVQPELTKHGAVAAVLGLGVGAAAFQRNHQGVGGIVGLHAGIELRWKRVGLRPGVGVSRIAPEIPDLPAWMLTATLGAEVGF